MKGRRSKMKGEGSNSEEGRKSEENEGMQREVDN